MEITREFAAQLHTFSLLLGIACGVAVMGIVLLAVCNREKRNHLLLQLRFEQAARNAQNFEQEIDQLAKENQLLQQQNRDLFRDNIEFEAKLRETRSIARERAAFLEQSREQLEQDFENLARRVLAEQGNILRDQHKEGLEGLLQPVRHQLDGFRKKVETIYDSDFRDRISLSKEIEHLKGLNERISQDALQLTRALQGKNKLQGQWGEMLLEKLLEDSGLRAGQEFSTQVAIRDNKGKLKQPDVIVHLPGQRDIIIDAKVSLKDYLAACGAEDSTVQQKHLKAHVNSVMKHVTGLSSKQYHQLPGLMTLEFVLLFIPVEGAFQAAVSTNQDMLAQAMKKKVIIASPSTLLAILRTIHHMWRLDEQNRNGLKIAREAGNLYDKFVGFVESFAEIGTRLDQASKSWQVAEKRLATGQGNLIARTETLKELGVQPDKEFPEKR
jgi:DNA recombination protein RmuC